MSDAEVLSDDRIGDEIGTDKGHNTKKVWFKEVGGDPSEFMMVDSTPVSGVSWKEKLLEGKSSESCDAVTDADLEIKDGNILQSSINGILVINFLERLRKVLVKDTETTVVIKLLGRNISYGVLHNHISSLWRPSQPFRLMDVKNGYYLPWTVDFDPLRPFPSVVMAWIHFLGLLGFLYKKYILKETRNLVGQVVKLDVKIDSESRGQFARMVVSVDLGKPLTSQVLINGRVQQVEFEALPNVCFSCGKYGHPKSSCSSSLTDQTIHGRKEDSPKVINNEADPTAMRDAFGPWMVVERKSRCNQAGKQNHQPKFLEENLEIGFKQGYFIKKIKSKRSGSSSGLSVEGNTSKGILGQGVTIGPAKKTSGLAHSGVEQKLLDLGHDLA
ncbi:hypothetical protein Golax_016503 [Gossypium laxum]|uniref:CCHC-type domain-containing protein n=1 Tax=Gossypium laxum TaxID=34288 RepID=A0A7J8YXI7_9ROSI|nr:hypothetical protein [Gossypium laxum]